MTTGGRGERRDVNLSGRTRNGQRGAGGPFSYLYFAACSRGPALLVRIQVFWKQRSDEVADGGHKLYEQTGKYARVSVGAESRVND